MSSTLTSRFICLMPMLMLVTRDVQATWGLRGWSADRHNWPNPYYWQEQRYLGPKVRSEKSTGVDSGRRPEVTKRSESSLLQKSAMKYGSLVPRSGSKVIGGHQLKAMTTIAPVMKESSSKSSQSTFWPDQAPIGGLYDSSEGMDKLLSDIKELKRTQEKLEDDDDIVQEVKLGITDTPIKSDSTTPSSSSAPLDHWPPSSWSSSWSSVKWPINLDHLTPSSSSKVSQLKHSDKWLQSRQSVQPLSTSSFSPISKVASSSRSDWTCDHRLHQLCNKTISKTSPCMLTGSTQRSSVVNNDILRTLRDLCCYLGQGDSWLNDLLDKRSNIDQRDNEELDKNVFDIMANEKESKEESNDPNRLKEAHALDKDKEVAKMAAQANSQQGATQKQIIHEILGDIKERENGRDKNNTHKCDCRKQGFVPISECEENPEHTHSEHIFGSGGETDERLNTESMRFSLMSATVLEKLVPSLKKLIPIIVSVGSELLNAANQTLTQD